MDGGVVGEQQRAQPRIDAIVTLAAAQPARLGRKATATDVQQLQEALHAAAGAIINFYKGEADTAETLAAIRVGMEGLAWHHGNVEQSAQPQLELGDTNDE